MSKYKEFQAKREQIKEYSLFHNNKDVSQKYYDLLTEVLEEFKKLENKKFDREGIQDWDGGESRYQAYLNENDEEVTDDDENCWVEYLPPTD